MDSNFCSFDNNSDNMRNGQTESSKREVFLPEDEDEFPFSKYTFNKKPEKEILSTSSELSSSSHDSATTDGYVFPQRQNSCLSHSQSYSSLYSGYSVNTDHSDPRSSSYPAMYHSPVPSHLLQGDMLGAGLGYSGDRLMSHRESATDMLFNLGFGGGDNFLPDRFARDWCQKIQKAYQERIDQQRLQLSYQQVFPEQNPWACYSGVTLTNKNKAGQFPHLVSQVESASGQQVPLQKTRNTLQKLHELLQPDSGCLSSKGRDVSSDNTALRLGEESGMATRDNDLISEKRNKQFLANKQKSLPSYLETLEEKDERLLQGKYKTLASKEPKWRKKLSTIDHSDTSSSNSSMPDSEEDHLDIVFDVQQNTKCRSNDKTLNPDNFYQPSLGQHNQIPTSKILDNMEHEITSDQFLKQNQFARHHDKTDQHLKRFPNPDHLSKDVGNQGNDLRLHQSRPRKNTEYPSVLHKSLQNGQTNIFEYPDQQDQSSNGKAASQGQGHERNRLKGQSSIDKASVPSIYIGPTTEDSRTDSMEVAEILVQTSQDDTVVDKSQKPPKINNLLHVNISDDRMLTVSPLSGSSLSPAFFSPVTVIEVNLDNQNDIMEAEDGSKIFNQNGFSSANSQDSDPGGHTYLNGGSNANSCVRRNSFIDALVFEDCRERIKKADTRRSSLDLKYKDSDVNQHRLQTILDAVNQTKTELEDVALQESDKNGFSANVDCNDKKCEHDDNVKRKDNNDVCIQADDGSLTPLLRESDLEQLLKCLEVFDGTEYSYYLAQDRGTQWVSSDVHVSSDLTDLNNSVTKETNRDHTDMRERGTSSLPYKHTGKEGKDSEMNSFINLNTNYGEFSNTGDLETQSSVWDSNVSMAMRQAHFGKNEAVTMDTEQRKHNIGGALSNTKPSRIGLADRDKEGLGNLSNCSSQVTIETGKDNSPHVSDMDSSDQSECNFPLFRKRESVDSQTMRKFFSSQRRDSIRQISLDISTYSQATQT
ncbi:uncharacterized protein LOC117332481 [Pecten maximus]|uniref:uncharacterized protein LOC117332481 n=1 Tax=Pecten maximus TaxID=6579 RepID=UPI001458562A|nr:uncharacterized protein LOC117332481 [Pecten maximus]